MEHQFAVLIGIEHPDEQPRLEDLMGLEYQLLGFLRTAEADAHLENQMGLIGLLRGAEADTLNLLLNWAIRLNACTEAGEFTLDQFEAKPLLKVVSEVIPDDLPEWVEQKFLNSEGLGKMDRLALAGKKKIWRSMYQSAVGMLKSSVEGTAPLEYSEADVDMLKEVGQKIVGAVLSFVLADLSVLHPTIQGWFMRWQASVAAATETGVELLEIDENS